MKKTKKILTAIIAALLLVAVTGALILKLTPGVNHAVRISSLLQPMVKADNQTMHLRVSVTHGGDAAALESDIYLIKEEDETGYLVLELEGLNLYTTGRLLLFENGKAFSLGAELQQKTASYENLLPLIGALYDTVNVTARENGDATVYEIAVPGDQVHVLLAAAFADALPVEGIRELKLALTEQNGALAQIRFTGTGEMDGATVALDAVLSGFQVLASGAYPIPDAVRQSAQTANPDELFSLTEDLCRLIPALMPFAEGDGIDGTLNLRIDCGLLQLDRDIQLSDLDASAAGQIDPQQLRALPEMLGLLCMEGDIRCTPSGSGYGYSLALDRQAMQELCVMISPELGQYGDSFTAGEVTILLHSGTIASMKLSIEGKISALIAQIPVAVTAEFTFG